MPDNRYIHENGTPHDRWWDAHGYLAQTTRECEACGGPVISWTHAYSDRILHQFCGDCGQITTSRDPHCKNYKTPTEQGEDPQ